MEPLVDEKGNKHYLTEELAQDGQGRLYRTKNAGFIIRHAHNKDHTALYESAKLMPLEGIENLVLPEYYLEQPQVGYILQIPDGFLPLSSIMHTNGDKKTFYHESGGIRRRLAILTELTKTLIKLNSLPCMYGGMTQSRIFISPKNTPISVKLLYSVKMTYAMPLVPEIDEDSYIAPESKEGLANSQSDIFALGALAIDVLTLGKSIDILSPEIKDILDLTQQKDGAKRPKLIEIYRTLMRYLDLLTTCKKCGTDFIYTSKSCTHCNAPPPKMLKAQIYDKGAGVSIDRGIKILEFATIRQYFWNFHTDHLLLTDEVQPRIECLLNISADKKLRLVFKNLYDDKELIINNKTVPPGQPIAIPMPCDVVRISLKLYSEIERFIDVVMI